MSAIHFPAFWSGMSPSAKASWLADNHYARNYSEACSLLSRMRRPKRHVIAPPVSLPQPQFVAEMERRKMF